MIAWLRSLLRKHVYSDVPAYLDACESCDWRLAIHCTEWQAAVCDARLACVRTAKRTVDNQPDIAEKESQ
jgi:hypothetical protein